MTGVCLELEAYFDVNFAPLGARFDIRRSVPMSGWKTKAGGIGMILTGAGSILTALSGADGFSFDSIQGGIALITGGLAVLGIGHKIEKQTS